MADPQKVFVDGSWRPLKTSTNQPAKECCCEPPTTCCLYPWPDPDGTPLYPDTDLPDTINVFTLPPDVPAGGIGIYTRVGYEYFGPVISEGQFMVTPYTPPGFPDGRWRKTLAGEPLDFNVCLIEPVGWIEDEFPDTLYLHDTTVGATAELLRISLCCWEGILTYINDFSEEVNVDIVVCYYPEDPGGEIFPDGWPGKPCWILDYGNTGLSPRYSKEDPQSSPEGDYSYDRDGILVVNTTP